MTINDAHCHFFSSRFFQVITNGTSRKKIGASVSTITKNLEWEFPGSPEKLADRWVSELDKHGVSHAALIASVHSDETSVSTAVSCHPQRFVGFFIVDPTQADALERTTRAFTELGLRCACLFPAMHRYRLDDARVLKIVEVIASYQDTSVFIHCGVLTVGVRKKLGLPSQFDIRLGDPLAIYPIASSYPHLPIIIPHFGSGLFRETLMVADLCPNVYLDTSSSNSWIKYHPGLTLATVFQQALKIVGPRRLLFGTDSSFFPRGWQRPVWEEQKNILTQLKVDSHDQELIFSKNFETLFGS